MRGGSSGVAPSSTGAGWTIFCTTSPWASSNASCAYGKSRDCATTAIRRRLSRVDGTCATLRSPTACSSAGDRRTSSSTCEKSSCSMRSSITRSSRRNPTRTIPNPERRALDKEIRAARADLARLEREYGAAAADNAESRRPTMRGFKIAHGRLGQQLRTARARVAQLFEQRRDVPKRVEVRDLNERAVVKL